MSLLGKVALVTGGAQGIGRAVVQSLLQSSAKVSVPPHLHNFTTERAALLGPGSSPAARHAHCTLTALLPPSRWRSLRRNMSARLRSAGEAGTQPPPLRLCTRPPSTRTALRWQKGSHSGCKNSVKLRVKVRKGRFLNGRD